MVGDCLSYSSHKRVEFKIFSLMRKKKVNRAAALGFKRLNSKPLMGLLSPGPWESALECSMSAWLDREFRMELEKKKRFSISSNKNRPHRKFTKLWFTYSGRKHKRRKLIWS